MTIIFGTYITREIDLTFENPIYSIQAYVEAENKYGVGQMSSIAVFRTAQKSLRRRKNKYNPTGDNFFKQKECCSTSGVKNECKFSSQIFLLNDVLYILFISNY